MGPLSGITVIEMRGIGPGPYAGMLLADMGANVIVVERSAKPSSISPPAQFDISMRNKKSIAINLKTPQGLDTLLKLVEQADVLFEGYRPGVAEKLGFGPDVCLRRNPKLIFGRLTGWGQTGSLSQAAGHDINYIALTGALAAIGNADTPAIPLNLIGDYAGGSLFLVMGILAALLETQRSGKGQVIDAAITDGTASLMALFHTLGGLSLWNAQRNSNLLDGAAPFYSVYETKDRKHVAVGPIEPQFYSLFIERLELNKELFEPQHDVTQWPQRKEILQQRFKEKSRDEWCKLLQGSDVCFAPVLNYQEAPNHEHNQSRSTYVNVEGIQQPAPAPRFDRSTLPPPEAPHREGGDTRSVLAEYGFDEHQIDELIEQQSVFE